MQPHAIAGGEVAVSRTRARREPQQQTRQHHKACPKHAHGLNCRPSPTCVNKAPMNEPPPSRKAAIGALVLIIVLVLGGVWIQRAIRANSLIEDCMLQGRKNCAPIVQ
jgi:hypothetical protein